MPQLIYWTRINSIEAETPKACLISAARERWMPKSQVCIMEPNYGMMMALPAWLFYKNKEMFRVPDGKIPFSDAETSYEKMCDGTLEYKIISGNFNPWYKEER